MGAEGIISMHSARAKNRLTGQHLLALPPKKDGPSNRVYGSEV